MRYKYTDKQQKEVLKSIVILIDTREQENGHITAYFDAKGIPWKSHKLEFGDYSFYIPANPVLDIPRDLFFTDEIVIERKAHLDELAGNLAAEDRGYRFEKELIKATKEGAIFDLCIENATMEQLVSGDYRSQYNPKAFRARLYAFQARFGISIRMMPSIFMGEHIYGRFYYYARERFGAVLMDELMEKLD